MPDQEQPAGGPPPAVAAALERAAAINAGGDDRPSPPPDLVEQPRRGPFGSDPGDRVASTVVDGAAAADAAVDVLGMALDQAIGALGLLTGERFARGDVDVIVLAVPRGRGNAAAERLEPVIARPPQ